MVTPKSSTHYVDRQLERLLDAHAKNIAASSRIAANMETVQKQIGIFTIKSAEIDKRLYWLRTNLDRIDGKVTRMKKTLADAQRIAYKGSGSTLQRVLALEERHGHQEWLKRGLVELARAVSIIAGTLVAVLAIVQGV